MVAVSKKTWFSVCLMLLLFLFFQFHFSQGSDTISPGQSLSGNQTLISAGGIFELGFFTPGNSHNYYIGIWYKSFPDKTVVWVANRKTPISDPSSSVFKLLEDGNLVLLNQSGATIWSTNLTSSSVNSTTAQLFDNANFVLRNALDWSGGVLWQSFDYPTDHWIPGSKVGYNKLTKERQILVSWRNPEDPAPSLFSLQPDQKGNTHFLLWNDSKQYWTSGEWTGKIFTQVPEIQTNPYVKNVTFVSNENESYLTYESAIPNTLTRFVLNASGQYNQFVWRSNFDGWRPLWARPTQQCEVYAFCGPNSICNQQKDYLCDCLEGFEPKITKDWALGDHTEGCGRRVSLQCDGGEKDEFLLLPNIGFQVSSKSLAVDTLEECELACLSNCSCNAFAYDNGCLIWEADIYNLEQLASNSKTGRDLHLRISASDSDWVGRRGKGKRNTTVVVCTTIAACITLFGLVLVILWKRSSASAGSFKMVDSLVLFKYKDLRRATKNFSAKLGEGGFGSVFRGTLPNSTVIAVKELKRLNQSEKQFRAEVKTIGMIQHKNLVRLYGFCAKASKRSLVYEYMPNGSLETLLFPKNPKILDWQSRYRIAIGTARGLAYLHEECRDCIIHCDIKPDNILLDAEYNPKVADFGLAKLFGREFSRVLTTMRGTRGYLAPEWMSGEAITPKADVFSYGMLLLEIISGRRNSESSEGGFENYFPLRVANAVNKGENVVMLLDDRLEGNAILEELIRACKVACWCIQNDEKDRPNMGQVVQILENFSEVGIPPIPRFLQHLQDDASKVVVHQETTSRSDLQA
ncbi:G-type lectin S-receptor-like serine/threonine-protein kinase At2g19130 [Mangifera indica]|uniref:G-type lectin S-receptor-like serine/threonine-protein kinase At2g19130 n=1 Tax=Mangifera indica TaxID=29780 RepID=UPI001CFA4AC5|nr:G-type lectin S-receptor-like serine/threonine-protein kinase At2g19130 [Mangifera indica]